MNLDDIAKLLAEKINQEHYIKHYLVLVYEKGLKDGYSECKNTVIQNVKKHKI